MAQESTSSTTSANTDAEYQLVIDDLVVEKITAYATQKVEGIIEMKGNILSTIQEGFGGHNQTKGVSAEVHDEQSVSIDLSVILEYGKSATEVFRNISRVVAKSVKDMTGLNVDQMTVRVVDVMTPEEYKSKQDS